MDAWTDRLSDYLDGALADGERAALEAHLTGCRDCAESYTQPLRQGRNRFLLRVRDCTAYLYQLP